MSDAISQLKSLMQGCDLTFFGGAPYVYHCHHYNLFHDQSVDDVLGEERGFALRSRAAREAFRPLLAAVFEAAGATRPVERVELATQIFAAFGHGRPSISVGPDGTGTATGTHLHYGFAWREKYGSQVKRFDPVDAVTAGFAAAATELAHGLPHGSVSGAESQCVAMQHPQCRIDLTRVTPEASPEQLSERMMSDYVRAPESGLWEDDVAAIADGLRGFLGGVAGDERGLVHAFNVFVTAHLSNYYNETIFEAVRELEQRSPAVVGAAESLFREAGHVCVFNTFGNILLSPEWESMVAKPGDDPERIVAYCLAIARSLGFGHWLVPEMEVGKRMVMRTTTNYEAPFYLHRYGKSVKPRCYITTGAALAIAVLAHRVKWSEGPSLDQAYYDALFRGEGLGWEAEVTRDQTMGDEVTEIVVTRR